MFRQPVRVRTRLPRRSVTAGLVAALVALGLAGSAPSNADDHDHLHHREHRLDSRIGSKQTDVDEISARLLNSQARLDAAVADLGAARSRLAVLRGQVSAAALVDRDMQVRLDQAVVRLRNARVDLSRGRTDVAATRSALTGYAVSSYQSGGLDAYSLGMAFDSGSTQQAVDSLQDVDAVLNKQAADLQQLQAMQVLLTLTEQRVRTTKDEVDRARRAAADNLALERTLEARAEVAAADVQTRVSRLRTDREQLASAKRDEIERLNSLQTERKRVEEQLRAIAARRARQHQASLAPPPSSPAPKTSPSTPASTNDGGFLSYPVGDTYITSPYGMRMHPILHIWELHDGTDFHADCGTAVYAAADGTVTEEYYNTGYGNRVIVDHGYVQGVSLATSYNHLTSFVAGVGEHVSRGQLIAYSGTTGYSTACHLHFMVYVNGLTVDPVTWL